MLFVSQIQKILEILYQSGETQIWFLIILLGALFKKSIYQDPDTVLSNLSTLVYQIEVAD
jgi:hypothetical protein